MIPGRFLKVLSNFDSLSLGALEEIIRELDEGYAKISWRADDDIFTGYLLVKEKSIFGVIVENIFTKQNILGVDGLLKVIDAVKGSRVHAVELYEATVDEIIDEYPEALVSISGLISELSGRLSEKSLDDIIEFLKRYRGELEIHDGSMAWSIYVENGIVRDAATIKEPKLYGDRAVEELLHRLGPVIQTGTYRIGQRKEPIEQDTVKNKTALLEGLELLSEKRKFEKWNSRRNI